MAELTWVTALAWFGVFTGAASVAGLIAALVGHRTAKAIHAETQETLKSMHATTQDTLTRMDVTTKDTLRSLGDGMTTMDTGLKQVLDRMDDRAEARYRDLRGRLEGEEGAP
jgi:hypothetical protein